MELSELSSQQEASLFLSGLEEWQEGPQVLTYGAILICRKGKAMLNVNYKDWELYEIPSNSELLPSRNPEI